MKEIVQFIRSRSPKFPGCLSENAQCAMRAAWTSGLRSLEQDNCGSSHAFASTQRSQSFRVGSLDVQP